VAAGQFVGNSIGVGTSVETTISSGGCQVVESIGKTSVNGPSGLENVNVGGIDEGAQISGGTQFDYGSASGVTIFTGSQVVEAIGTASGTIISGGTETVSAGGIDLGAQVSGGTEMVLSGGVAISDIIFTGLQVVSSGGTAIHESPECLRRLLVVRWYVLAEIGEPLAYPRIGRRNCDRCIELGDHLLRCILSRKERIPLRKFQPGEARLADVRNTWRTRQSVFGHHSKRFNRPRSYLLNAVGRRRDDQIDSSGQQIL
jgi:autotransporter passenger strand-loop-strand repeat protein